MTRPGQLAAAMLAPLLGALCAVAIGCGGSSPKLLAPTDAASLKQTLTLVRQAVDARDCAMTDARLKRLKTLVGNLPGSVDRGLRQNLREQIDGTLAVQARAECQKSQTTTVPTITSAVPTTAPTTSAPTTSTPTQTTTPSDTSTTTSPPTDSTPTTTPSTTDSTLPTPPGTGGVGDGSGSQTIG